MKKIQLLLLMVLGIFSLALLNAQEAKEKGLEAITKDAVQGQLEFLASDWTEGRHAGKPGAYMAADYIASMFQVYGLEPAGDITYIYPSRAERMQGRRPTEKRTYFQNFSLIEYQPGDEHELALIHNTAGGSRTIHFDYQTDFSVQGSDVSVEMETPVVFVGYGLSDEETGYDDYKDVNVKGKTVLYLTGYPGHRDSTSKAFKAFNKDGERSIRSMSRDKRNRASELGAAAVIEVDPNSENPGYWADNLPFRYNTSDYEGDTPRASYYSTRMRIPGDSLRMDPLRITLTDRALNELLNESGIHLKQFEERVKSSQKPASREIGGKKLKIKTSVESRMIQVRNVVGVLPGKDTSEIIVIGGHYDHLGKHDGWIWNGADDNASGTVGVMTIAKACMATGEKPEKTIVFAAWTAEEKGLLGSRYFADHPFNDARMILNLNYDMISRDDRTDTLGVICSMTYTRKYPILQELSDKHNETYDLGLNIRYRPADRPRGGSDHTPFAEKDIPIFYFMAGFPPEYHQPSDHTSLVNWDKMTNIIKIGYLNIWDLANTEWGPEEEKE